VIKHPCHVLSWIFKILNTCTYSFWRFLTSFLYSRWDRRREWKIPCTDLHVHVGRLKQLWLQHFQCMKKIFKPITKDLIGSGNRFFNFSCTFYIVILNQFTLTLHAPKYPHTILQTDLYANLYDNQDNPPSSTVNSINLLLSIN